MSRERVLVIRNLTLGDADHVDGALIMCPLLVRDYSAQATIRLRDHCADYATGVDRHVRSSGKRRGEGERWEGQTVNTRDIYYIYSILYGSRRVHTFARPRVDRSMKRVREHCG